MGVRRAKRRYGTGLAVLVAGMLGWGAPGDAAASSPEVFGFGHRAMGMGMTGALAQGGVDAVYAHPSVIGLDREASLQVGLISGGFELHAEGPNMPGKIPYAGMAATTIGAVLPLPFGGILKDRLALGLGFVTPLDVVVRGRILYAETPQFLMADRVQTVSVLGGLSADLGHGVRLGLGLSALAALQGSVIVATDATGRVGTRVEDALVATYAPTVSASYDIDEQWRVGATFRGALEGKFNVVIEVRDLGGITVPPLNISGIAQYDPLQVTLEATRRTSASTLSAGLTYAHWAGYPGPLEATVRCEDAPEPDEDCAAPGPPVSDYSSTVSPRVGAEYRWPLSAGARFAARAGYAFVPQAAPEQTGRTNYFDGHRSVGSLGWGWALSAPLPPLRFDGFAQLGILHPREHHKVSAPSAEAIVTRGLTYAFGIAAEVVIR